MSPDAWSRQRAIQQACLRGSWGWVWGPLSSASERGNYQSSRELVLQVREVQGCPPAQVHLGDEEVAPYLGNSSLLACLQPQAGRSEYVTEVGLSCNSKLPASKANHLS